MLNAESPLSFVLAPRRHDFSKYIISQQYNTDSEQAFFIFNQKGEVRHISLLPLDTLLTILQVLISRLFRSDVK